MENGPARTADTSHLPNLDGSSCCALRPPRFPDIVCSRVTHSFIMTIENSTKTTEGCSQSSSSGSAFSREAVPDEMSPLLQTDSGSTHKSRRCYSERWLLTTSAFLDRNAGLFLVAASQLFFSLSNITVKWLNGSDEQIPMLEVCNALECT